VEAARRAQLFQLAQAQRLCDLPIFEWQKHRQNRMVVEIMASGVTHSHTASARMSGRRQADRERECASAMHRQHNAKGENTEQALTSTSKTRSTLTDGPDDAHLVTPPQHQQPRASRALCSWPTRVFSFWDQCCCTATSADSSQE